ncbi:hypothetical protein MesoLjLc_46050 [Mesorhizobium sp. L-8-10]|nr:hypothetical protein MesoLjLc_46050 [Mesorhizobium sp. L-8-10]
MSRVGDETLRSFLAGTTSSGGVEELVEAAGNFESARGTDPLRRRTLEKLARGTPLEPDERFHLEAIIIPEKRPAIDIIEGDYQVRHPDWLHFNNEPVRSRLRAAIAGIGRIELPNHPTLPYGGTGFVAGDGLLMTNRHVAEIFAEGLGTAGLRFIPGLEAGIDFLKERRSSRELFLRVKQIVMIHPHWDMALLKVEGLPSGVRKLTLSTLDPGAVVGREVAVVGYPTFDIRNPADVQNMVFGGVYGVKRLQPGEMKRVAGVESYDHSVEAALHDSSTLGGNSGSCVLDPGTGEVVGLHFGGRYAVANYCVPAGELARDGRVIDAGVGFSAPVTRRATKWDEAWRRADALARPKEDTGGGLTAAGATRPSLAGTAMPAGGETSIVIPLEITVRLGQARAGAEVGAAAAGAQPEAERAVEPIHDADYSTRKGYDARFLGVEVPIPEPRNQGDLVRMENGSHVIPYHHFSVVMHKKRRLALLVASNVSARPETKRPGNRPDSDYGRKGLGGLSKNDREKWFSDPRILAEEQLPDKFYNQDRKAFDKGHIARREDVAWGQTYDEMRNANGDTFHVTNCSPQILGFNRSSEGADNWGDLENLVLSEAKAEGLAVFAGPVLAADDPIFSGVDLQSPIAVRIPRRYWKLIVAAKDGRPQSFGFLLEQDLSAVDMEFAVPQRWRRFMAGVGEIEALAGIDFSDEIRVGDQSGTAGGAHIRESAAIEALPRPAREPRSPKPVPASVAPRIDLSEILDFWRGLQKAGIRSPQDARFVVGLAEPISDATIESMTKAALGLEVVVGPLFAPDRELDRFRAIDVPGVVSDDRSDLFDVARVLNDVLGSETVEPDLSTRYYEADRDIPPEGSAESADWAFWCWVNDDPANRPVDSDWAINKTKVRQAWVFSEQEGRPRGGKGIIVFQPDTGVVPGHPELPKNIHKDKRAANFVEIGKPPVDPMNGGGNPGHGTGTGSVVASPEKGRMSGSAPDATLVPIRCVTSVAVFDQSRVAQAIDHARLNGAHVITMSLGGVFSSALHAAVKKAVAANIIVVAAAGNCVGTVVWPARYDEMIAVGGINEKFRPWIGSSHGGAVDISGPAELVLRADARDPVDPGKVGGGQGTSFATAHLAGVAACWLAHHGRDALLERLGPGMTLQDLFKSLIRRSAIVPAGFNTGEYGAGIVDAEALLRADPTPSGALEAIVPSPRTNAEQVRDLLAEVGGRGQAEAAGPMLTESQNLLEMACIGLDMARIPMTKRAQLESLPPLRISGGLKRRMDPVTAQVVFRGGVR